MNVLCQLVVECNILDPLAILVSMCLDSGVALYVPLKHSYVPGKKENHNWLFLYYFSRILKDNFNQ